MIKDAIRYFLLCLMLNSSFSFAQDYLNVFPTFEGKPLALEKMYSLSGKDSTQFETLKFYISDVQLSDTLGDIYLLPEKYFLIDLTNPSSQRIPLPKEKHFTQIEFNLGIDSLTNVSGAMEGALDPTNGMYWTWQSGYINFKLEGTSSACPARNHFFLYHLGGYQFPNNAVQNVQLKFIGSNYQLFLPIDDFLRSLNISETYEMMRPCAKAVELSVVLSHLFTVDR